MFLPCIWICYIARCSLIGGPYLSHSKFDTIIHLSSPLVSSQTAGGGSGGLVSFGRLHLLLQTQHNAAERGELAEGSRPAAVPSGEECLRGFPGASAGCGQLSRHAGVLPAPRMPHPGERSPQAASRQVRDQLSLFNKTCVAVLKVYFLELRQIESRAIL